MKLRKKAQAAGGLPWLTMDTIRILIMLFVILAIVFIISKYIFDLI
ncbi:hypothetical protein GOV06_00720 [Candidatus Woesearchaeota archaeon]|nr:hypothetical protein [Candidatus Woesearchaeota archaeon]